MRSLYLAGLTGLALASLSATCGADDWPIPQNPAKARQTRLFLLMWTDRTLSDPYEKVGKKDPRWDKLVRELMKAASPLFLLPDDADTHDDVYQPAKRAIDAGCDDPIVLYIYARTSTGRNFPGVNEYERRLQAASTALESSKYPAFRRAAALIRFGRHLLNRGNPSARKEARRCLETALALMPESFRTDGHSPYSRRFMLAELQLLLDAMKRLNGDSKSAFDKIDAALARIPDAKAVRLDLRGEFYTDYAWEARGSGFADSVTEDGWRKFAERASEARKAFEAAWNLDPLDGDAASRMITVEMAIGEGNRAEMEKWFRRAMEADSDNLDACRRKLYWLAPRWHGSDEDVLSFARACRDTKNWRSGIPFILPQVHRDFASALAVSQRADFYQQPEIWQDIRGVYLDYIAHEPENDSVRSEYAGYCYLCSQYQEAYAQFQKLGDRLTGGYTFPEEMLKEFRLSSAERVNGEIKPGSPPAKGFAVLQARYGAMDAWGDVTRQSRINVANDRLKFTTAGLPDPIFGVRKALAIVYSLDGKVGLSITAENQAVSLPPKDAVVAKLTGVPAEGFAVLAAQYGADERWLDVTDTFRKRITNGKLDVSTAGLPDPAYFVHKALVIAYAWEGKVLVSITSEDQKISLPVSQPSTDR